MVLLAASACAHRASSPAGAPPPQPVACAGYVADGRSPLLPGSAAPTVVPTPHFEFSEGPVWVRDGGYLLFSTWNWSDDAGGLGPPTTIYKLTPPATVEVWSPRGELRSNGLALDAQGALLVAAHDREEVTRVNLATHERRTVAGTFSGKAFNSPNDLAVRADGTIYFTDPDYQKSGRAGQGVHGVYRISPSGEVAPVDRTRRQPNGIALSPDQRWLYVGGADELILRYPVAADGSTGAAELFVRTGSNIDGMSVDCAGNVYASLHELKQVRVYSAAGAPVGSIPTVANVTNVAFGGPDGRTLYITTAGALQALPVAIPGLPY